MTGKKFIFKLIFGALFGGMFLFAPTGSVRAQVALGDRFNDVRHGGHADAYEMSEEIRKQKEMGIDRGSNIKKIDHEAVKKSGQEKIDSAKDLIDDFNIAKKYYDDDTYTDRWTSNNTLQQESGLLKERSEKELASLTRKKQEAISSMQDNFVKSGMSTEAALVAATGQANKDFDQKIREVQTVHDAAVRASTKINDRIKGEIQQEAADEADSFFGDENVYEYTTTDAEGNTITVYVNSGLNAVDGVMEGCMPVVIKFDQVRKCIFCPLFLILFNTAQSMSKVSYDALADGFANVMLITFALYLAFVSLKQVSSFTKQDGPKFISETLTQAFKVLLAYLILKNVEQLYDYVLSPVLSAGIDFGTAFLFRAKGGGAGGSSFDMCIAATALRDGMTVVEGHFDNALFAKIDCFVRSVQEEIAVAQSIGSSLMCVSVNDNATLGFLPDLTMLLSGLITWLFSWLICLAFAFYLIDAVVRLGIVGALMPFLVAAWPFKPTQGYTTKGWSMFMNSFFTFVFLGIVVSVNIELCGQAITGGEGGIEKVIQLMNEDKIKELNELISIGAMGLLFLILCCIFGFKLCSEAITLAQSMSEAKGGSNIGSKLGSAAMGTAKWGAKIGGKAAFRGGKDLTKGIASTDAFQGVKGAIVGSKFGKAVGSVGDKIVGSKAGRAVGAVANQFKGVGKVFGQNFGVAGKKGAGSPAGGGSPAGAGSPAGQQPAGQQPANAKSANNGGGVTPVGNEKMPSAVEETSSVASQGGAEKYSSAEENNAAEAQPRSAEQAAQPINKEELIKESEARATAAATAAAMDEANKIAASQSSSSQPEQGVEANAENQKPDDKKKSKDSSSGKVNRLENDKKDLEQRVGELQNQINIMESKMARSSGQNPAISSSSTDDELVKKLKEELNDYKTKLNSISSNSEK